MIKTKVFPVIRPFVKHPVFEASVFLLVILNIVFYPALWKDRTLMTSVNNASVMPNGAYQYKNDGQIFPRTADAGAPSWQTEPWFKLISHQYLKEKVLPLWNPYNAFGVPLAASMQPQPFFPLTAIMALFPDADAYDFYIVLRLFLAGLFAFLFARLFLNQVGALFASVVFMLSGYFIVFLNMEHLSVEVLAPAVLYGFEKLLRTKSFRSILGCSLIILLTIIGGMPESTLLILLFGYFYYAFRVLTDPCLRVEWRLHFKDFLATNIFGFLMSAFLLIPFIEFLRYAHDTHQLSNTGGFRAALCAEKNLGFVLSYLVPLVFGPHKSSISSSFSYLLNYVGIMPTLFSVFAVLAYFRIPRTSKDHNNVFLVVFFSVSAFLVLSKRFGLFYINWVAYLPLIDITFLLKYQEPIFSLSVAMLSGVGFSVWSQGQIRTRCFFWSGIIVLFGLLVLSCYWMRQVGDDLKFNWICFNLLGAAFLIVIALVLFFVSEKRSPVVKTCITYVFLGFVSLEMFFNFIYPTFYMENRLPSSKTVAYEGAPYVSYLRSVNLEHYRVFGLDGVLHPNWSGAFQIQDVRLIQGMYYYKFHRFIRNFLLKSQEKDVMHGDLADRFTGKDRVYQFKEENERRFLELSSVRYFLTMSDMRLNPVVNEIMAQNRGKELWGLAKTRFVIDNESSTVLFQHPPSRRLTYRKKIDKKEPVFHFSVCLGPQVYEKSDGAGFLLEINVRGRIDKIWSTVINPRENPEHRHLISRSVDLSEYAGQEVELLFSTDPGVSGDNAFDWAGWSKLYFTQKKNFSTYEDYINALEKNSFFKNIYANEIIIFEVETALPRASIFNRVEMLDEEAILARLKESGFNQWDTILISRKGLSESDKRVLKSINEGPAKKASPARIVTYRSQKVIIEVEVDRPSVLMLNDIDYPGWTASLNGRKVKIYNADYLFRAVVLPKGKHRVEFQYKPKSFYIGGLFSVASLVGLLIFFVKRENEVNVTMSQGKNAEKPSGKT